MFRTPGCAGGCRPCCGTKTDRRWSRVENRTLPRDFRKFFSVTSSFCAALQSKCAHNENAWLRHLFHRITHAFPSQARIFDTTVRHVIHAKSGDVVEHYSADLKLFVRAH